MNAPVIAVEPECWRRGRLVAAVEAAGATVGPLEDATALVWADPAAAQDLPGAAASGPHLDWIQLPYAGIEPFLDLLDPRYRWTCGKGVYARPVAEHVLALLLAGFHHLHGYARSEAWGEPVGRNLPGSHVLILGAGGITRELLPMLAPHDCRITVARRSSSPIDGADRVVTIDQLADIYPTVDVVVVALALTPETEGVLGADAFAALPDHAWIINVGRGGHVVTDALVAALAAERLGGAALDVTEPEPLPADHPLWTEPRCIITPHVANTPEVGLELLAVRVEENVRRFLADDELLGPIDLDLGY